MFFNLVQRISASGYNADIASISRPFVYTINDKRPLQAAPLTLGIRSSPPYFEGIQGWTYAYGGCASNFLDCYFLDHSPCPKIVFDTVEKPNLLLTQKEPPSTFDKNRSDLYRPHYKDNPDWWIETVGRATAFIPPDTIKDFSTYRADSPSNHMLYKC